MDKGFKLPSPGLAALSSKVKNDETQYVLVDDEPLFREFRITETDESRRIHMEKGEAVTKSE
jgi:hypothetical protein